MAGRCSGLLVLVLIFVLVLPLVFFVFLLAVAVVVLFVAEHEGIAILAVQYGEFEYLRRLLFGRFALARFPVFLPDIEDQVQPGPHVLDGRQLTGQTWLAAWARRAWLSLRSLVAALARRPRLAARAVRAFSSGMTLRSTRAQPSLSGYRIVRHARNSLNDSNDNLIDVRRPEQAPQASSGIDQHQSASHPAMPSNDGRWGWRGAIDERGLEDLLACRRDLRGRLC